MALYFYQNFSRIRYRVSYTFLLPAILFLLFCYSREHLQIRFRDAKNFLKVIWSVLSVAASAAVICYANVRYFQSNLAHSNVSFDAVVQDYVKDTTISSLRILTLCIRCLTEASFIRLCRATALIIR